MEILRGKGRLRELVQAGLYSRYSLARVTLNILRVDVDFLRGLDRISSVAVR